jgi:hypothetical protein
MFAMGTAAMFLAPADGWSPSPPPTALRWIFLSITLVGGTLLHLLARRLRKVSLEDGALAVSHRGREVRIRLQDVARVAGSVLMNPELVWIHFRRPTEVGTRIAILPPMRFWRGFAPHPLAAELAELVRRAQRTPEVTR